MLYNLKLRQDIASLRIGKLPSALIPILIYNDRLATSIPQRLVAWWVGVLEL